MADQTANEYIAEQATVHSVNMLRVEASLRNEVLAELKRLESELTFQVANLPADTTDFKRGRLNALLGQTTKSIDAAYELIAEAQGKSLAKVAGLDQAKTNQILNNAFQVEVATVAQSPKQLEAMVGDQILNGRFHKDWWATQGSLLRSKFEVAMRDGMSRGEGIDALVKRVRGTPGAGYNDGVMAIPKRQAEALVRTSIQSAANAARLRSFLANQDIIKGVQWRSTLDKRTTVICQGLDGKQWSLPDFEPVGHDIIFPGPIAHWNCRSVQTAVTRSWSELSGDKAVKPPGKPPEAIDTLFRKKLEAQGMSESQIAAALEEKRLAFDGEAADPESFNDFLKGKSADEQNQLLGPHRAQLWREGKIGLSDLIDQNSRPLTIDQVHGLIAKNEALATDVAIEGQNGVSLIERKLLEESMVQGVQQKAELTHFLNLKTGERITINGRSPSAADLEIVATYPQVAILRNALSVGDTFSPQEINLMGKLPNFQQARIVTPNGKLMTITIKNGRTFDTASAAQVNSLAATSSKAPREALKAALRSDGAVRIANSQAGAIAPSTKVFNQQFGTLSLPQPLAQPPPLLDAPPIPKGIFRSTAEVVAGVVNPTPEKLAAALNANAEVAKPSIDQLMVDLAKEVGGKNESLKFSVKQIDSLTKKITKDAAEQKIFSTTAATRMGDTLRYTIVFEDATYAVQSQAALDALEKRGYLILRAKNKWDDPEYHGINAVFHTPEGLFVELQLHTADSFNTKQFLTHDIYKELDLLDKVKDEVRIAELKQQNIEFWKKVSVPSDSLKIHSPAPSIAAKITLANIEQFRAEINSKALAKFANDPLGAFKADDRARTVPLSSLISTKNEIADRAYAAGLKADPRANATEGMLSALRGSGEARAPLDVRVNGDGTYTILDGNATAQAAMLAKWKNVRVIVHDAAGKIVLPPIAPDMKTRFPASIDQLTKVSSLGGTTGADLFIDPVTSARYVLKRGGGTTKAEHIRNEALADDLYRAMGVPVPASKIYETASGPVKVARFVEDSRSLKDFMANASKAEQAKVTSAIQRHFGIDALLGNLDVLGTNMDNVLIDSAGKAWRIDNGGALAFRAQGAAKGAGWNQGVLEMWSMRKEKWLPAGVSPLAANLQFFQPLDITHVARQILSIPPINFSILPPELAAMMEKRIANAKLFAHAALDAVDKNLGNFKVSYVEEMVRYRATIREAGIHEAMPKEMKPKSMKSGGGYDTQLIDENGKEWGGLNKFGYGAPPTTQSTFYQPQMYDTILQAVKSYNAAIDNPSKPVNQAKLAAAFKLDIQLALLSKTEEVAANAQSAAIYNDVLQLLKKPPAGKKIPDFQSRTVIAPKPSAKAAKPIPELVTDLMAKLGIPFTAPSNWMEAHTSHTWEGEAYRYKIFLAEQSNIPKGKQYYFIDNYNKKPSDWWEAFGEGKREEKAASLTFWHALVQEVLDTVGLPNVDRERRVARVMRTDPKDLVNGTWTTRGMNESGSMLTPVSLNNRELTIQAVPFSRVTGLYPLGRPDGRSFSFAGPGENEISFIASDQPFAYAGTMSYPTKRIEPGWTLAKILAQSSDAYSWNVPIDRLIAAIEEQARAAGLLTPES